MNVWLVLVNLEWPCFLVLKSTRIIKLSVFDVGQNRERERESCRCCWLQRVPLIRMYCRNVLYHLMLCWLLPLKSPGKHQELPERPWKRIDGDSIIDKQFNNSFCSRNLPWRTAIYLGINSSTSHSSAIHKHTECKLLELLGTFGKFHYLCCPGTTLGLVPLRLSPREAERLKKKGSSKLAQFEKDNWFRFACSNRINRSWSDDKSNQCVFLTLLKRRNKSEQTPKSYYFKLIVECFHRTRFSR